MTPIAPFGGNWGGTRFNEAFNKDMSIEITPQLITDNLHWLEKQENISVYYAAEAGSRAWGFPSADSDYDVRFIFKRSLEDLLKVNPKPDNVECHLLPCLDYAGWDLRKTLALLAKSNASLLEWLHSPTSYMNEVGGLKNQDGLASMDFHLQLKDLALQFIDARALIHHYSNMAQRCLSEHLVKQSTVRLKKYFYAIRPILAANYVYEAYNSGHPILPPVNFEELFLKSNIQNDMRRKIKDLYNRKLESTSESQFEIADIDILDWIQSGIRNLRSIDVLGSATKPNMQVLDDFLHEWTLYG